VRVVNFAKSEGEGVRERVSQRGRGAVRESENEHVYGRGENVSGRRRAECGEMGWAWRG